jgi:hypothetical protein
MDVPDLSFDKDTSTALVIEKKLIFFFMTGLLCKESLHDLGVFYRIEVYPTLRERSERGGGMLWGWEDRARRQYCTLSGVFICSLMVFIPFRVSILLFAAIFAPLPRLGLPERGGGMPG